MLASQGGLRGVGTGRLKPVTCKK